MVAIAKRTFNSILKSAGLNASIVAYPDTDTTDVDVDCEVFDDICR